jgi:orotate phosphoribosyltransferase
VLSVIDRNQYIFPDKKVTALAVKSSREKSELVFGRHEPAKGERWIIVEDICNNFSTTADLVNQIEQHGAQCVGIVCFLDRSEKNDGRFSFNSSDGSRVTIPVISLVRMFIPQYQQDDPEVLADVRTGNVIWKPKIEWDRLAKAMAQVA